MNNAPAILKSLVVYAICVPLAAIVGYMLTDPLDYSTFAYAGVLVLVLIFPLLLRWHYPLLLFSLNSSMVMFFMMGRPASWLVMVMLSLGISLLDRALNSQKRFIHVPQITWPLICMLAAVHDRQADRRDRLARVWLGCLWGQKIYCNRREYFKLFCAHGKRIPREWANLYVTLFILGSATYAIGDLTPITPSFLRFIYWVSRPTPLGIPSMMCLRWERRGLEWYCKWGGRRFLDDGQIRASRGFSFP